MQDPDTNFDFLKFSLFVTIATLIIALVSILVLDYKLSLKKADDVVKKGQIESRPPVITKKQVKSSYYSKLAKYIGNCHAGVAWNGIQKSKTLRDSLYGAPRGAGYSFNYHVPYRSSPLQ